MSATFHPIYDIAPFLINLVGGDFDVGGDKGGGSGRSPFATYGRHDGALLFKLRENFVYHLTVQTGKFGNFAGIHRFAGLAHSFKNYIFLVHNIKI